jgi:hypothetical protein
MDAFIQLKVGADGELAILIHKQLWEDLRRGEAIEEDADFMRVSLTALTRENLVEIAASGGTQQYPCRRAFQLEVEI